MTPKAISDVNRSERIERIERDLRQVAKWQSEGTVYESTPELLNEAADELARLRVDAERMDFLEQRVRDTHGQFFYNIGKRISFDWAGAGTLRNAIDAAIAASRSTGADHA